MATPISLEIEGKELKNLITAFSPLMISLDLEFHRFKGLKAQYLHPKHGFYRDFQLMLSYFKSQTNIDSIPESAPITMNMNLTQLLLILQKTKGYSIKLFPELKTIQATHPEQKLATKLYSALEEKSSTPIPTDLHKLFPVVNSETYPFLFRMSLHEFEKQLAEVMLVSNNHVQFTIVGNTFFMSGYGQGAAKIKSQIARISHSSCVDPFSPSFNESEPDKGILDANREFLKRTKTTGVPGSTLFADGKGLSQCFSARFLSFLCKSKHDAKEIIVAMSPTFGLILFLPLTDSLDKDQIELQENSYLRIKLKPLANVTPIDCWSSVEFHQCASLCDDSFSRAFTHHITRTYSLTGKGRNYVLSQEEKDKPFLKKKKAKAVKVAPSAAIIESSICFSLNPFLTSHYFQDLCLTDQLTTLRASKAAEIWKLALTHAVEFPNTAISPCVKDDEEGVKIEVKTNVLNKLLPYWEKTFIPGPTKLSRLLVKKESIKTTPPLKVYRLSDDEILHMLETWFSTVSATRNWPYQVCVKQKLLSNLVIFNGQSILPCYGPPLTDMEIQSQANPAVFEIACLLQIEVALEEKAYIARFGEEKFEFSRPFIYTLSDGQRMAGTWESFYFTSPNLKTLLKSSFSSSNKVALQS